LPSAPSLDSKVKEPLTAGLIRFFSNCGMMKAVVSTAVQLAK
jgi:hypothetical protein